MKNYIFLFVLFFSSCFYGEKYPNTSKGDRELLEDEYSLARAGALVEGDPTGFLKGQTKKQKHERTIYPPMGLRYVAKNLFEGIESYVKNCDRYPSDKEVFQLIGNETDCFKHNYSSYFISLMNEFKEMFGNHNFIISSRKEGEVSSSFFIVKTKIIYDSKIRLFDGIFNRKIEAFAISCNKLNCIYQQVGVNNINKEEYSDMYSCANFDWLKEYYNKEKCELSKNSWSNVVKLAKATLKKYNIKIEDI